MRLPSIEDITRLLSAIVPSIAFLVVGYVLFTQTTATLKALPSMPPLAGLGLVVVGVFVSLAAAFGVRKLLFPDLDPLAAAQRRQQAVNGALRDRLAQNVVVIGTVGIGVTALLVIVAVSAAYWGKDSAVVNSTSLSIFTATLPVFSTWVGTVLAFYFSNESFKQAAGAALAQSGGVDLQPITTPGTMIPFEKIIRFELKSADVQGKALKDLPGLIKLADIRTLFQPPGVTRVVVFDDRKRPLYVIRHELMPSEDALDLSTVVSSSLSQTASTSVSTSGSSSVSSSLSQPATAAEPTLQDYLDAGSNASSAKNFALTAATATVGDARRLYQIRKVTDLFITDHGRADEAAIGWVPDDNLRQLPAS